MAGERIIIGSKNPAKIDEWSAFFVELGIKSGDLFAFGNIPEPKETGITFIENARIKAAGYAKQTNQFVFADDGGYEIDYLGGWPGVKSRRILPGDMEGKDEDLINIVLTKMKGVPTKLRTVRLTSSAALSDPNGTIIFEDTASSTGYIAEKPGPVLTKGYPFRSIHFLPELGKTYAELTEEEMRANSHKRPVAEKLARFLLEYSHA